MGFFFYGITSLTFPNIKAHGKDAYSFIFFSVLTVASMFYYARFATVSMLECTVKN